MDDEIDVVLEESVLSVCLMSIRMSREKPHNSGFRRCQAPEKTHKSRWYYGWRKNSYGWALIPCEEEERSSL